MERPFFSLSKSKRIKPIDYISPDGSIYVRVTANAEMGMATIWDADILIWAASHINDMRNRGINNIPRTLNVHPYDLLRTIHRETGGREYNLLRQALRRLQSTTVYTNIRAERSRKKERQFSWIESYRYISDAETDKPIGLSIVLSDWFYEGVLCEGGLLAIDPVYFSIAGGRERWLYRVARKHAGGAGDAGFSISMDTLFEKSGAEGRYRRFKFEMNKIIRENRLPGFDLRLETREGGEPILHIVGREFVQRVDEKATYKDKNTKNGVSSYSKNKDVPLPLFEDFVSNVSESIIMKIKKEFPGWDIEALRQQFDAWLATDPSRKPRDYEAAFLGFVRRHHASHSQR